MRTTAVHDDATTRPDAGLVRRWALAGCVGAAVQIVGGLLETFDRVGPGQVGYVPRTVAVAIAYLLMTGTLLALWRSAPAENGRALRVGLLITGFGWMLSCAAQLVLNARFQLAEQFLFPVATVLIGVGMLLVGGAVVLAHLWRGWRRWTPVICGLFPFLVLFPSFAVTGGPNFAVLAIWGLCWLAAGLAVLPPVGTRHQRRGRSGSRAYV